MTQLNIGTKAGDGAFKLPLDAVTQTIAVLAKRRAGKSYTMRRLVEQLFKAGQQVVLVDPKGDQWGIRSAADGKSPGLPVVILGGERGDVPLEASSGEVVAKLVVEQRVSVLLDLSLFRKHEVATFMTAFMENLYRLKAREIYRTPMMLVIDEADAVAPQKPQKGEERMLGAAEDIVRRGGQRGIGCVLVSQRSAVLNKNVLTQAQMLIVLRTIAPQDLAAMKAWIDVHGDVEQGRLLMDSLPSLPVGDAWFWSPGWPTTNGIFELVHVLPIETFDSGASPKPGMKMVEPKNLADVDLAALKGQMAATIEKAKADDPRELKRQVAELTKQLAAAQQASKTVAKPEVNLDAIKEEAERRGYLRGIGNMEKVDTAIEKGMSEMVSTLKLARDLAAEARQTLAKVSQKPARLIPQIIPAPVKHSGQFAEKARSHNGAVSRPQQKILDSLAWLETVRILQPRRGQVALVAEVSSASSGFEKNLSTLRTAGLIDYPGGNLIALTDAGRQQAVAPESAPTTEDLHESLFRRVSTPQAAILRTVIDAHPTQLSRSDIAQSCNVSEESSGFEKNLSTLRSLGLIDYPGPGMVSAREVLFIS